MRELSDGDRSISGMSKTDLPTPADRFGIRLCRYPQQTMKQMFVALRLEIRAVLAYSYVAAGMPQICAPFNLRKRSANREAEGRSARFLR